MRRLQAMQTEAVAEAPRRDLAKTVGATSTAAWLGDLLTVRRAAAARVDTLAGLLDRTHPCGHRLAGTGAAFAAGRIDADQARVIAEAVHALPAALGDQVIGQGEELMLDWAGQHAAPVLNGYAQHLLAHLAPDIVEQAEAEALARADARDTNRANTFTANPDHRGRIRLRGELDPEAWALVSAALEPFAKPTSAVQPGRAHRAGPPHRRAAAAPTPWSRSAAAPSPPTRPRPRSGSPPTSRSPSGSTSSRPPSALGTLDTGTPIAAEDIRRYACDATILPVLLNSAGVPLDVGRAIRVFTKELRRAVELRDLGCAFPGCDRPRSLDQRSPHHPLGRRRTHRAGQRRPALRHPPQTHPPPRMAGPPRTRPPPPVHPTRLDRPHPPTPPQHRTPPLLSRTRLKRTMSGEHHLMRQ